MCDFVQPYSILMKILCAFELFSSLKIINYFRQSSPHETFAHSLCGYYAKSLMWGWWLTKP